MTSPKKPRITVSTEIEAPIEQVWKAWTLPEHIKQWNFAIEAWHCPHAINDLKPGGTFNWRMEAKDGSMGFDFAGTYDQIDQHKSIHGSLDDGRSLSVQFEKMEDSIKLTETFEIEDLNTSEQQQAGWQAILENFKAHVLKQASETK